MYTSIYSAVDDSFPSCRRSFANSKEEQLHWRREEANPFTKASKSPFVRRTK